MKFVTVRDFRLRPGSVWKSLEKDEDIVITSKGKPIAILTGTSDSALDETIGAIRRSRAELAVSRMRKMSLRKGLSGISVEDIDAEIKAVRKARRR